MENNKSPKVKCPYCNAEDVYATMLTIITFKKECPIYVDGVYIDEGEENIGTIIGEIAHEPILKTSGYCCHSCGEHWIKSHYKLVKDRNGYYIFEKGELEKSARKRKE